MSYPSGRHFLQIPGPTNVPEQVLRAMAKPTIDHRGPEFKALALEVFDGLKPVFKTAGPVMIFASSGTGAWEAGLVNTLSPGDKVLMFETGHFATLWKNMAVRLGLEVDFVPGDWRHGVDPAVVEAKLAEDRDRTDQVGDGGPQRDLDRRAEPGGRDPQGDRPDRPSGPLHGRYDLLPRLDRLPP